MKEIKSISGPGLGSTCYHVSELSGRVRIQVNARDTVYLTSRREIRRVHSWLGRYLRLTAKRPKKRSAR